MAFRWFVFAAPSVARRDIRSNENALRSLFVQWLGRCRAFPAAVVLLSCARPAPVMSDSTYVRAMAGLRQVNERAGLDSAARETARDSVLRANKTTRDQMERMAAFLAKDSERAAAVFHAIEKRAPAATP